MVDYFKIMITRLMMFRTVSISLVSFMLLDKHFDFTLILFNIQPLLHNTLNKFRLSLTPCARNATFKSENSWRSCNIVRTLILNKKLSLLSFEIECTFILKF